jgi:hypothetical protein|tara:strand:+ start:296 stop:751 length:456 start_codon:yes stop_codon:yes gene_type:complete
MTMIKKLFFYIMLLTLVSCGYEPLYSNKTAFNLAIQSFQVEGNKNLNRKIISSLNLKNKTKATGYRLIINSNKSVEAVSKDATGKTSAYRTKIDVKIILMDGVKLFKQKDFSSNFTYNNIENKFDLSQYQREIETNLINGIIEKIFIFLTF